MLNIRIQKSRITYFYLIFLIGLLFLTSCNDDVVIGDPDSSDDNIVLLQNIDYDSIVNVFYHTIFNPSYNFEINNDSIPDFNVDMKVFTGEVGVLWLNLIPIGEEWSIATMSMSDTISIDTTIVGSNGIYSTKHTYYDPEIDDSWEEIKTYRVPFISDHFNVLCSDLNFNNEKLLVYADPFFTLPPGEAFAYDYINPGIKDFDGYIFVQNDYQCFSIRSIYDGGKLELGTPRPL